MKNLSNPASFLRKNSARSKIAATFDLLIHIVLFKFFNLEQISVKCSTVCLITLLVVLDYFDHCSLLALRD